MRTRIAKVVLTFSGPLGSPHAPSSAFLAFFQLLTSEMRREWGKRTKASNLERMLGFVTFLPYNIEIGI